MDRSGEVFNRRYSRQLNGECIWQRQTLEKEKKSLRLHWTPWDPVDFHGYALIQNLWRGSIYRWCPDLRRTTESSLLNVKVFTSCHLFTQRHLLLLLQNTFRNFGFYTVFSSISHLEPIGPLVPLLIFAVGGCGWPVKWHTGLISSVLFILRGTCHHVCSMTTWNTWCL